MAVYGYLGIIFGLGFLTATQCSAAAMDDLTPLHQAQEACKKLGPDHTWTSGLLSGGSGEVGRCLKGEVPDGPVIQLGLQGQVKLLGQFLHGQQEGNWRRYH